MSSYWIQHWLALGSVGQAYADTHARLADDPEYMRLKAAADTESVETPDQYLSRNLFAIYVETQTEA